jgi:lipopolysaccharide/colanic/teichoic acid biosynthesis glycosyltransferase
MQRIFDVTVAATVVALSLPILVVVGLAVSVTSNGGPIYLSSRVGRHGRVFRMLKFRTMVLNADRAGPLVTAGTDSRITPIGRFLRHTKLDELPSLLNVVRGDMSIVGPRPESPIYVCSYTDTQKRLLEFRPGLTSPATVKYRNEEELLGAASDLESAYRSIMNDKLAIDLAYFNSRSLTSDLRVIARTLTAIAKNGPNAT